ncbi:hypothetical protein JCM9533A_29750 [Catenuloplanes niger JCM 9533]
MPADRLLHQPGLAHAGLTADRQDPAASGLDRVEDVQHGGELTHVRAWALEVRARAARELGDTPAARADLELARDLARQIYNDVGVRRVDEELRTLPHP